MKELESDHGDTMGEQEEKNVTTYFFSHETAAKRDKTNSSKTSEQTLPQNKVYSILLTILRFSDHISALFQVTTNHNGPSPGNGATVNHPVILSSNSTTGDDVRRGSTALIRYMNTHHLLAE